MGCEFQRQTRGNNMENMDYIRGWFPPLKGLEVLGLASGGDQQCPVFAAHGAKVTVVDISEYQLAKEK